jgi:hypothetical protein
VKSAAGRVEGLRGEVIGMTTTEQKPGRGKALVIV